MKAVQTRENVRKLKLNPHQSKEVQSQSPPHKKLLKKIEMIHKEPTHKYDLSLKENLLAKEPEEEVAVDFRVEIERRFNKALPNQIFKFPRRPSAGASDGDDSSSSTDSSFESLKHVTIYDLSSQNNKRKHNPVKQALRGAATDEKRMPKSVSHRTQTGIDADMSDDSILFEEEERSGIPIEVRMRDKTTATYRKLLSLIDQQLNPAPEVQPPSDVLRAQLAKKQQNNQEQHSAKAVPAQEKVVRENTHSEYNKSNTKTTEEQHHDVEIHKLEPFKTKKERNVRSQGRNDRPSHHYSESQRASKAVSNSGLQIIKKNLSQEKMGKIETVPSLGFSGIEKTLSRLNISTAKGESKTTVDLSKLTQESFKKLYNNSLLKSVTPQYVKSSKIQNLKENVFKAYAQENPSSNVKTTMDNLYQKAKNEVLNHKLKVSGVNLTRSHTKIGNNSMSATKRDETPKDASRKINLNNFYGNTDIVIDKSASKGTASQSMSKKESMKAFQVASPYKKQPADSPVYANYEFTQPKVAKKPSFKLDLNKRGQAYRDALSSARNRKKRTPDKFSDVLTTESAIRNSYDMQQFSYILNSSSQKNTGKKPIGFTPSSVAKNMSFTKAFFSFK